MFPGISKKEIVSFLGAHLREDVYLIPPGFSIACKNLVFNKAGEAATRFGHSIVLTPNDVITSMFSWLPNIFGAPKNYLVYYAPAVGVRLVDLSTNAVSTVIPVTGAAGASFANAGSRFYAAFYNANILGAAGGQVYSSAYSAADPLFAPPVAGTPAVTQTGSGVVTTGVHRLGYVMQTRSGFTTAPSPSSGSLFSPVTFTASGTQSINVAFTQTYPTYASTIWIIMTTTTNLNEYYLVPGGQVSVPGGSSFPVNVNINISDSDLEQATPADQFINQMSATLSGGNIVPPILPYGLATFPNRMVYLTLDPSGIPMALASEPNAYQQTSLADHGIYLPGNLSITCAGYLRGVFYLFGPHWTFATNDNGQVPALWPQPEAVDLSRGTKSPNGVWVNATQGYMWVADTSGLYLFLGGQYPADPCSYFADKDWKRINWQHPEAVFVVDDADNKRVIVLAPLDGASTPNFGLVFDYSTGFDATTIKYSIWNITGYSYGAATLVQNDSSKRMELWFGPSSAGSIIRYNNGSEANPYRDPGNNIITSLIEHGAQPGMDAAHGMLHIHSGAFLRIRGAGFVNPQWWTLDHNSGFSPPSILLGPTPGAEILVKNDLLSEQCSLQLQTASLDSYFILSKYSHLYTLGAMSR